MEWLNYHHLLYFWTVAREGSVTRASQQLRLAQPTVSGQLKALEDALGEKLFERTGRRLVLTDVGRVVLRYADEIFSLGRELQDTLKGRPTGRPIRFTVGVADAVPKLVAYRLLLPALSLPEPVHVVCREDKPERLLAELSVHSLDLVISDSPVGAGVKVKAYSHLLGETPVAFFGPVLMPTEGSTLRRSLDQWLDTEGIRPRVVGEIEDGALLKVFGQAGVGLFAAPVAIEAEVRAQFGVKLLGRVDSVKERFYALSAERKLKHPAVVAICEGARRRLFG
jgi:LysR family transcriptional regulator, transcriptional activator of nhaA